MSDLISRSALLAEYDRQHEGEPGRARKLIADAPAVDAVPVVRCKDCAVPHNKWTGCPNLNGLVPPPNHFCSFGERKDNG